MADAQLALAAGDSAYYAVADGGHLLIPGQWGTLVSGHIAPHTLTLGTDIPAVILSPAFDSAMAYLCAYNGQILLALMADSLKADLPPVSTQCDRPVGD